ncbi:MAG: hypothetical protein Q4C67_09920, partial [Deinococcus sp.]|nr:hypothetical protein [Deinococcus sp.]
RAAGERLTEAFAPLGLSEPAGRPALQAALADHQAARQEVHDLERAREAHRHSAQRSEELRTELAVLAGELGELESEREDARHRRSAYAARLRELQAQLEQPDMARLRTRLDELRRQERGRQRRHQELVSEHTASQTELRLLEGRLPELQAQEQAARAAVSAATEALEQARAAHPRLSTEAAPDLKTAGGSQEVETAQHSLIDAFERVRPVLEVPVSYYPRLTAAGPRFLLHGEEATPDILFHHLSEELDRTRLLLNEEEARLFHDELIRELVEELDGRQRQAHGWTEDIRAILRRLDFHGERLDLQSSVTAGRAHVAGRLPELIDARTAPVHQPDTWWRSVQDELRQTIRRLQQEEGAERSLSERLAQTLDYRQWLEFGFYSVRETGRHPLTDANFARRSGGERSA